MRIESEAMVATSTVLLIRQISGSQHSLLDPGTLLDLPDLRFLGTLSHPYFRLILKHNKYLDIFLVVLYKRKSSRRSVLFVVGILVATAETPIQILRPL